MSIWTIDATHSEVGFSVKHMMFTNVRGKINAYEAKIELPDENFADAKIFFKGSLDTIDTNNVDRDNHLKSEDFFDVVNFPELIFESDKISGNGPEYIVEGNLTIKGVTQRVVLNAGYSGKLTDPWGNTKIGLNLTGKINRKDFGLNWNQTLEAGGLLVGEEVRLVIELQLIQA